MIKRYNICSKKTYEKNGTQNTMWLQVGTLVKFPATADKIEGYRLELNMFPDSPFYVFEQKPKEERSKEEYRENATQSAEHDVANDLPF